MSGEVDFKEVAEFLFDLLDDIDTVSDWAKGSDAAYRRNVERIQRRRFEVATVGRDDVIIWHERWPASTQHKPETKD